VRRSGPRAALPAGIAAGELAPSSGFPLRGVGVRGCRRAWLLGVAANRHQVPDRSTKRPAPAGHDASFVRLQQLPGLPGVCPSSNLISSAPSRLALRAVAYRGRPRSPTTPWKPGNQMRRPDRMRRSQRHSIRWRRRGDHHLVDATRPKWRRTWRMARSASSARQIDQRSTQAASQRVATTTADVRSVRCPLAAAPSASAFASPLGSDSFCSRRYPRVQKIKSATPDAPLKRPGHRRCVTGGSSAVPVAPGA
jgi:hypothetical protein